MEYMAYNEVFYKIYYRTLSDLDILLKSSDIKYQDVADFLGIDKTAFTKIMRFRHIPNAVIFSGFLSLKHMIESSKHEYGESL